jgi:hypothetical protein
MNKIRINIGALESPFNVPLGINVFKIQSEKMR